MITRLALEDGTVFTGLGIGAAGTRTGEVVFNTAMTGYQEVFTDPSYCGQIVTMTFPLQGNYGINHEDVESTHTHLSGVVLRELPRRPSNYRAQQDLGDFLTQRNIIGIAGIDTRALTRRVRKHGALRGAISTELDPLALVRHARNAAPMQGANLVPQVTPEATQSWTRPLWTWDARASREAPSSPAAHVVVIDCGTKHNILRHLASQGVTVTCVPADTSADAVRALRPDGLLVSNGPGDPAAVPQVIATLRDLVGHLPIYGICLGHQVLALALGAKTYKMPFGHHGANMPVLNTDTGQVEITSQNHGFAVDRESLDVAGARITHVNLNDDTIEGFRHDGLDVAAVQFHPEASPGPHDSAAVFEQFVQRVQTRTTPVIDVSIRAAQSDSAIQPMP